MFMAPSAGVSIFLYVAITFKNTMEDEKAKKDQEKEVNKKEEMKKKNK